MKSTHLTIKGEGYHVICNEKNEYLNSQLEYTNSSLTGTDLIGSFQSAGCPYAFFQFEFNNPWIGTPWGAIGKSSDENGRENDKTNFNEGESKIFNLSYYDGGDDGEYDNMPVKVTRLDDTDTKNFIMELNYYGPRPIIQEEIIKLKTK